MIRGKLRFAPVVLMLLSLLSARATVVPTFDLDRLTAEATLIAVGEIVSVTETGKTVVQAGNKAFSARSMVAELRVDRVLKTENKAPSSSIRFRFALPDEFAGWRSIAPLSYRIFFLQESSGEFQLVSPYYPSLIAVPRSQTEEGTPIERVIAELAAVLESQAMPVEQKRQAVSALDSTQDPTAIRALKRVAQAQDLGLRLSVTAALLHHNDISTLPFAENTLLRPDPMISPDLLQNLIYAIFWGVKDERAVPSLGRLLQANNTEVRRAAASALMHTGDNSCIDPLLHAINDSDFEVRYYSIVGLAEITGQTEWRPNMDDFKSDERKYLNHWYEWSQSR